MDGSRFPIELCEHIIDSFRGVFRRCLCYISLVCSAWLPRSRFDLYHEVHLWGPEDAELLFRTLEESPLLASLDVELHVLDNNYMQFTQLARLLKNCTILNLFMNNWLYYPPRFADTCLYQFSLLRIVELEVVAPGSLAPGILCFIRSLTKLEKLTLWGIIIKKGRFQQSTLGAYESESLQRFQSSRSSSWCTMLYPLTIRCITSEMLWWTCLSLSLLFPDEISDFHQLQKFHISVPSHNHRSSHVSALFSILRKVSSGSALCALSIDWYPEDGTPGKCESYLVDRGGLLDILVRWMHPNFRCCWIASRGWTWAVRVGNWRRNRTLGG
ncbi:hypothetical protein C8Q74DRAFT_402552 [Fomes fomentarius]|nr:hypothetical protein C8Q74DRAFT_402552 [Fomes fomentarius]